MFFPQQNLLCLYRYDPLDRLISHTQPQEPPLQRFYCNSRLSTEIQGALHHSIVQHDNVLLAQQLHQGNALDTTLLATDVQRSVLHTLKANHQRQPIAYSPYGHRRPESGLLGLLGFNGELPDPVTECYLLGNGYRAFNPGLMRFISPDSWSPFGQGGLNSYAYCLNDPINLSDQSGHSAFSSIKLIARWRRFAKANIAKAKMAELDSVRTTNSIQLFPGSSERFQLKAGVTPEQAIAKRNRANELDYLGQTKRHTNGKFLSDLDKARRESRLLRNTLGIASSDDRLTLLNYIKDGEMDKGSVMSFQRLGDAGRGVFDPKVQVQHRPRPETAQAYSTELLNFMEESRMRYFKSPFQEEAYRIRQLNFRL